MAINLKTDMNLNVDNLKYCIDFVSQTFMQAMFMKTNELCFQF